MSARTRFRGVGWRIVALGGLSTLILGAGGDRVVVRVETTALTVRDVERRLAALPDFQRRALAKSDEDIAAAYVEQVLVRELLLANEATKRKLGESVRGRARTDAVLGDALLDELRREVESKRPVTPEQVAAYYEKHRDQFRHPTAIRIWRIVVGNEKLARDIITQASAVDGPTKWSELSRKHSRDKATAMRKGDLGFVLPDGKTHVPRVQVAREVYEAAAGVRDGELVPIPVREGKYFAVVWRRGTKKGFDRALDDVREEIEEALIRARHEHAIRDLLDGLQRQHVKDLSTDPLSALDALPLPEVKRLPPPILSARGAARPPQPRPTDRGLR